MNASEWMQQLYADGTIETTQNGPVIAAYESVAQESGYGRWLSVLGAWIAVPLILGFLGALSGHLLVSNIFCAIAGSLFLATGLSLGRTEASKTSVLIGQFALIACVTGGVLLSKALLQPAFEKSFETGALFTLGLLCVPLLVLAREQGQRQLFALAALGFVCIALAMHHFTALAWLLSMGGLIGLAGRHYPWVAQGRGELFNTLTLTFSLGSLLTPWLLSDNGLVRGDVSNTFDAMGQKVQSLLAHDLAWALMGAFSALVVAVVGYRTGLRSLRAMALGALLAYGYLLYFALGSTLLHKALALLASGLLLLVIRRGVAQGARTRRMVQKGAAS